MAKKCWALSTNNFFESEFSSKTWLEHKIDHFTLASVQILREKIVWQLWTRLFSKGWKIYVCVKWSDLKMSNWWVGGCKSGSGHTWSKLWWIDSTSFWSETRYKLIWGCRTSVGHRHSHRPSSRYQHTAECRLCLRQPEKQYKGLSLVLSH